MLLNKLFGNTFGIIWLVVFMMAVLILFVWLLIFDKDNGEVIKEVNNTNGEEIEVVKETTKIEKNIFSEYEIIESEDGFFRVRKSGSDRILRKLLTREEAEKYVEERSVKK